MKLPYEDAIRAQFEVVSQHGDEFLCKCPFHNDTGRPNLYINGKKGLYLCHACRAKGSLKNVDVPPDWEGMLRDLSVPRHDRVQKTRTYRNDYLKQFQHKHPFWTTPVGEEVPGYPGLLGRGYSEETVAKFELGYDLMRDEGVIPVRDHRRRLIGVIRRRFDDDGGPRYLYPKQFPLSRVLFGVWKLGMRHTKVALVEGSLDAIACWNARIPALALLGARLSSTQHRQLHQLGIEHVVIFTDRDTAGREAIDQIIEECEGLRVSVARYRSYWEGKDPGRLTPAQIRKGYHSAKLMNALD